MHSSAAWRQRHAPSTRRRGTLMRASAGRSRGLPQGRCDHPCRRPCRDGCAACLALRRANADRSPKPIGPLAHRSGDAAGGMDTAPWPPRSSRSRRPAAGIFATTTPRLAMHEPPDSLEQAPPKVKAIFALDGASVGNVGDSRCRPRLLREPATGLIACSRMSADMKETAACRSPGRTTIRRPRRGACSPRPLNFRPRTIYKGGNPSSRTDTDP